MELLPFPLQISWRLRWRPSDLWPTAMVDETLGFHLQTQLRPGQEDGFPIIWRLALPVASLGPHSPPVQTLLPPPPISPLPRRAVSRIVIPRRPWQFSLFVGVAVWLSGVQGALPLPLSAFGTQLAPAEEFGLPQACPVPAVGAPRVQQSSSADQGKQWPHGLDKSSRLSGHDALSGAGFSEQGR